MKTYERTYEKRLGWPNTKQGKCRHCNQVHEWMSQGCVPVIVPDQWLEEFPSDGYISLPDEVEGIKV